MDIILLCQFHEAGIFVCLHAVIVRHVELPPLPGTAIIDSASQDWLSFQARVCPRLLLPTSRIRVEAMFLQSDRDSAKLQFRLTKPNLWKLAPAKTSRKSSFIAEHRKSTDLKPGPAASNHPHVISMLITLLIMRRGS